LFTGKTIFYGALDWGLGHATRSVPIIKELLKNNTVILGITPFTRPIFDEEFPQLKKIELPAYNVTYSKILPVWIKLALSYPEISRIIKEEYKLLDRIIDENKVDVVISDSRFGLHSKKLHSIFISHQLFLKAPVFEQFGNKVNRNYILNFDEVWVPDHENGSESLSGELSHGEHFHDNVKYIGPQSRLKDAEASLLSDRYDYLFLLSGPEPTRSELEVSLLLKWNESPGKTVFFVRGSKDHKENLERSPVSSLDHPTKEELKSLIFSSNKIICRSGYSTLMDMHLLGKKDLILIPTPGQTEQEYLAEYWKERFGAQVLKQNEINKLLTL
jgi:hypothetical protein